MMSLGHNELKTQVNDAGLECLLIIWKFLVHFQSLRNYVGTSAFADVSYLMADVEAKFYV